MRQINLIKTKKQNKLTRINTIKTNKQDEHKLSFQL
jgi:hypothetical protein